MGRRKRTIRRKRRTYEEVKLPKVPKVKQYDAKEEEYKNAPHSFVFHRGHVGKNVRELVKNVRQVMEPFTAKNLQVRKNNVLKDYLSVAGLLHVSHFIIFTKTDVSVNMKLCRIPRGPTLTFKVHQYCLTGDTISALKKPNLEQLQFLNHPLLVMNNFGGQEKHVKLMSSMFQNMFPSINVHKVKLNDVRRCVLVNYNPETKLVDFRHYNIRVVPVGMSRGLKKFVQTKVPNLGKYKDISDYVTRTGYSSESEVELDGQSEVVLPQQIRSRGNIKSTKSAVRLTELGPRMTLQLVKIEEGLCAGEVMFHEFITKTPEEVQAQQAMRKKKQNLKEARKRKQQENVERKQQLREEHKQRSLAGTKKKEQEEGGTGDIEDPGNDAALESEDDDVAYFREEVGQNPDPDSFKVGPKRKRQPTSSVPLKKTKIEKDPGKREKSYSGKGEKSYAGKGEKSYPGKGEKSKAGKKDKKQRQPETIQQQLIRKKARKLKLKQKKIPKYKRKMMFKPS